MRKHKSKSVNGSGFSDARMPMLKIKEIKHLLMSGQISYSEAKNMAEKPLQEMNERMAQIGKKFGFKPKKVSLGGLLR